MLKPFTSRRNKATGRAMQFVRQLMIVKPWSGGRLLLSTDWRIDFSSLLTPSHLLSPLLMHLLACATQHHFCSQHSVAHRAFSTTASSITASKRCSVAMSAAAVEEEAVNWPIARRGLECLVDPCEGERTIPVHLILQVFPGNPTQINSCPALGIPRLLCLSSYLFVFTFPCQTRSGKSVFLS